MAKKKPNKIIEEKPKDPTNTGRGRPRRDIDWTLFEQLCSIQCTRSELASFLKVDQDTMINAAKKYYNDPDFSEIYKRFSDVGKCSLRRYQFVQAKTKPNMAIWLGKQWLGQRENVEDLKDLVIDALQSGIKQISKESRGEGIKQPEVEAKPPLSNR